MTAAVSLTVPGRPVPAVRMTQRTKWTAAAQRSLAYQRTVAYCALAAKLPRPLPWPAVGLTLRVYLQAVKDHGRLRLPRNAGDWDNYAKAVQDGLQHGQILANDRCVIEAHVRLHPCATEAEERVEVELWPIEEGAALDTKAE